MPIKLFATKGTKKSCREANLFLKTVFDGKMKVKDIMEYPLIKEHFTEICRGKRLTNI